MVREYGFSNFARRNHVEIIAGILETAKVGVGKTDVMYRVNLSHMQAEKHIKFLIEKGLLKETKRGRRNILQISDKGLEYLHKYEELNKMIRL
jgi:predicted transcriptional regulator